MKGKKIALGILATACTIGGAVALFGCSKNEHVHDYSTDFTAIVNSDGTSEYHAHKCKDETCNVTSGSEKHALTETNTATCTEAGVKTVTCSVCGYQKSEQVEAIGHDYEWSVKDSSTHTGVCKNAGCAETTPAEEAHEFTESIVGNYVVSTCSVCGAELAEVKINLFKRINDTQSIEYTGADLKVSLHKIGDGNYTKVYEAAADRATGVATLKIQEGAYWIRVEDQTNGYLSVDASWIRFDKNTAETDSSFRNIILSESAQYTFKLLYDNDETNPATGVTATVYDGYKYNVEPAMILGEGVTDENGEVTFTLASSFDLTNSPNLQIKVSGFDTENYNNYGSYVLTDIYKNKTTTFLFYPKLRAFTIKVKAEENFVEGVGVKLTKPEYDEELQQVVDKVVASGTTDANGQFVTETINNDMYKVVLELPDEIAENWKLPYYQTYTNIGTGEVVVNLVSTPTYNLTVSFPSGATCEKSGVKLTVKDLEDNVVAEGTTNEEGKFTVKLEFAEYKVYVDETTLPDGFTVLSSVTTVPMTTGSNNASTLNKTTNSVSWTVANLYALVDVETTVKKGAEVVEGIVVKLYLDGELKFTSNPTNAEGKTTLRGINRQAYDVVLEGLPENTACSSSTHTVRSLGTATISIVDAANFALTIKDENGNALEGATVNFYTLSWNRNNLKYTETQITSGVTAADGTVTITCALGTYYVGAVGADGTKYWCNVSVAADTVGQNVTQEITVHSYDIAAYTTNSFSGLETARDNTGKEVLTIVSANHQEEFSFGTLTAGKYVITIDIPDNFDFAYNFMWNYDNDNWLWKTIVSGAQAENNDFLKFNRDGAGRITSIEWTYDETDATKFRFTMSAPSDGGNTLYKVVVKVDKVEA